MKQIALVFVIFCIGVLQLISARPSLLNEIQDKLRETRSVEDFNPDNNELPPDDLQSSHFGIVYVPFFTVRRYYIERKHLLDPLN